jgi:hypothetical protein
MQERLTTGHRFDILLNRGEPEPTEEQQRDAWEQLRDVLIRECQAGVEDPDDPGSALPREHGPGTRPWGWWEFEAREPRRQVRDGPEPVGEELSFGMPRCFRGVPPDGMYEPQSEYLARLGIHD